MKYVLAVLCVLFSTVTFANETDSRVFCYDKHNQSTLHVEFNPKQPNFIYINDFKYEYVRSSTEGDVNKVVYKNFLGSMHFTFVLDGDKMSSIEVAVDGRAPNEPFFYGECK